jgi:hypothetical protein
MLPVRHPRAWLIGGWVLIIAAVIGSLLPAQSLPPTGVGDKFQHSFAYAFLALWWAGLYPRSRYLVIALGLFALGVGIEWAQGAMKLGRHSDYRDVFANSIGIGGGLLLAALWLGGWAERIDGWTRGRETIKRN